LAQDRDGGRSEAAGSGPHGGCIHVKPLAWRRRALLRPLRPALNAHSRAEEKDVYDALMRANFFGETLEADHEG
jgi:hypothetical protein